MRLKFLPIAFLSLLSFKFDPYNTMIANASNTEHNIGKCDEQYTLNTKEYWDCRFKTRDWHNNNGTDQTFEVTAPGDFEERAQFLINGEKYIGKKLTVQFQGRTDSGIPRFPIGKLFRDEDDLDGD